MNHTERDIELIEKYFDEGLSEFDAASFERRINTDDSFRTLVEQEKYIIGAIRIQGLKDELEQLKRMEATLKDPHTAIRQSSNRRWYALAAAVVALIIVARFALMPGVTTEDLYEDHFRPYPNVFEPTLRGQSLANDRTDAFKAYEKGDYKQAAALFRTVLQRQKDPGVLLLLGNCNLMLGNTAEAIVNFSKLAGESSELSMQAKWFLSLAYLKDDDKTRALPLLKELAATDASYADKAKEILKELE
ncbi:MAG TPA: tetratricopeptide repeat protein [Chryseolinea sp.]|nr:tetratricopeptide repeat protein [Chryseolinea sp.]